MAVERTRVFLDASVLVAAARSPSGGSALALQVCAGRRYQGVVTARVLLEARVNIAEKFGAAELVRYYEQLASLEPEVVAPPSKVSVEQAASLTGEKDAHVLGAALVCGASALLTLDRRHFLNTVVCDAKLSVRGMTPGEFLAEVSRRAQ